MRCSTSPLATAAVVIDFQGVHQLLSSTAFEIDLHTRHRGSTALAERAVAAVPALATALDRMFALMQRLGWQKAGILSPECSLVDYSQAAEVQAAAALRKVERGSRVLRNFHSPNVTGGAGVRRRLPSTAQTNSTGARASAAGQRRQRQPSRADLGIAQ